MSGPFNAGFEYKPGFNKSNRKCCKLDFYEKEDREVNLGIHLFNSRKAARLSFVRMFSYRPTILGKVRVQIKHFVAGNNSESVFAQVWLSRDEYRRIKRELRAKIKKGKYDVA